MAPGWILDVWSHVSLTEREGELHILACRVLVLGVHDRSGTDGYHEAITLRVTPAQAERLEQAQRRGPLRYWISRPIDDPDPAKVEGKIYKTVLEPPPEE